MTKENIVTMENPDHTEYSLFFFVCSVCSAVKSVFFHTMVLMVVLCLALLEPSFGQTEKFQDRFLYGMVTLESGEAKWVKGGAAGSAVLPGSLLPKHSVIETGADQTADLRLGCGSVVRLGPVTKLRILPFSLELEKGAVLARHLGTEFPMTIGGASALIISKGSLVDVERQNDKVVARVQIGGLKTPGLKEYVRPGQSVEASGRSARITEIPPVPRAWDAPSLDAKGVPPTPPPADVFGDEPGSDAAPVDAPPEPGGPPVTTGNPPPTPTPAGSGSGDQGDIPAEDWMKNSGSNGE